MTVNLLIYQLYPGMDNHKKIKAKISIFIYVSTSTLYNCIPDILT